MSPKGKERTTRNSSQTRNSGRGPHTADPSAPEEETSAHKSLSPHEGKPLPEDHQNNDRTDEKTVHVSVSKANEPQKSRIEHESIIQSHNLSDLVGGKDNNKVTSPNSFQQPPGSLPPMGDNTVNGDSPLDHMPGHDDNTNKSKPEGPWQQALRELKATSTELKAIRERMGKLDTIEAATSALTLQLSAVVGKTSELETKVEDNSSKVRSMEEEINTLKERVKKQDREIEKLSKLKEDYKKATRKTIGEMNELIQTQKDQVDSFHEKSNNMKRDIMDKVDSKMEGLSKDLAHHKLKNQAYRNKQNLVITGLEEEENKIPKTAASEFIESSLKIKDIGIESAYRIGAPPTEGSTYNRPLVVKFSSQEDRNKVWKKKVDITGENDDHKIRVQADLPKQLREGVRVLNRVAKAAAASQEFKAAVVRDYAIRWNGKEYLPSQLESLPRPLRPSTLATRSSGQALVFFSKHTILSNHHPSVFKIKGITYHNVEQYLAHKRAILSGQEPFIQKARQAKNPATAKSILNSLKEDHPDDWNEGIEAWATEAVRAKFNQNESLADFLCNTGNLQLGEASRNGRWGVGMDLDNPKVLDFANWPEDSNLLGKVLMKVRTEIKEAREQRPRTRD